MLVRLDHITPSGLTLGCVADTYLSAYINFLNFEDRDARIARRDSGTSLPGGNSEWEPPDPIPNSEVKLLSADGSTRSPRARVGHRQAPKRKAPDHSWSGAFFIALVFSGPAAGLYLGRSPLRGQRPSGHPKRTSSTSLTLIMLRICRWALSK